MTTPSSSSSLNLRPQRGSSLINSSGSSSSGTTSSLRGGRADRSNRPDRFGKLREKSEKEEALSASSSATQPSSSPASASLSGAPVPSFALAAASANAGSRYAKGPSSSGRSGFDRSRMDKEDENGEDSRNKNRARSSNTSSTFHANASASRRISTITTTAADPFEPLQCPPSPSADVLYNLGPILVSAHGSELSQQKDPSLSLFPLQHSWVLWYDKKQPPAKKMTEENTEAQNSNTTTTNTTTTTTTTATTTTTSSATATAAEGTEEAAPQPDANSWLDHLQILYTVDDAISFWRYMNNMLPSSALEQSSTIHFFKKGITPTWEDPAHTQGGKWTIRLSSGPLKANLDMLWQNLLVCLVGENIDSGDEVTGAVLSKRRGGDRIAIWNRSRDEKTVLALGYRIRQALLPDTSLAPHQIVMIYDYNEDSFTHNPNYSSSHRYTI